LQRVFGVVSCPNTAFPNRRWKWLIVFFPTMFGMRPTEKWLGSNEIFFIFPLFFLFSLPKNEHVILFIFISNLVFILLIVIYFFNIFLLFFLFNFILIIWFHLVFSPFLIEFCFQFHPLIFNFELFFYQI